MVAVQAEGCAPIVKAFEAGEEHAPRWEGAAHRRRRHSRAEGGRRFPDPARGARKRRRRARRVDAATDGAVEEAAREDGLLLCPEGGATLAAWRKALDAGLVGRTSGSCCSIARPGSNIRCRTDPASSTGMARSTCRPLTLGPSAIRRRGDCAMGRVSVTARPPDRQNSTSSRGRQSRRDHQSSTRARSPRKRSAGCASCSWPSTLCWAAACIPRTATTQSIIMRSAPRSRGSASTWCWPIATTCCSIGRRSISSFRCSTAAASSIRR